MHNSLFEAVAHRNMRGGEEFTDRAETQEGFEKAECAAWDAIFWRYILMRRFLFYRFPVAMCYKRDG